MRVTVDKVIPQEHISALERLCQHTKDIGLFLHAKALLLRSQGKSLKEIRKILGLPESTVKLYTKRLKKDGIVGLIYHGQTGNRSLITKEQYKKLQITLSLSEAWYPEHVKQYIMFEFGVNYIDGHSILQILKREGYVYDARCGYYLTLEAQQKLPNIDMKDFERSTEEIEFLKSIKKRFHFKHYKW